MTDSLPSKPSLADRLRTVYDVLWIDKAGIEFEDATVLAEAIAALRAAVPPTAPRGQWEAFANNDDGDGRVGIYVTGGFDGADAAFEYAERIAANLNRGTQPPPATRCNCGAQQWPDDCVQIEDSHGRLHTLRGCQPGASVTKPGSDT